MHRQAAAAVSFFEGIHRQGGAGDIAGLIKLAHIKPRLLGHWGTTPGLNFIYVHLNRLIKEHGLDRFHLVADVIDRVPQLGPKAAYAKQVIRHKLIEHKQYIAAHGEVMPEIRNWKWSQPKATA